MATGGAFRSVPPFGIPSTARLLPELAPVGEFAPAAQAGPPLPHAATCRLTVRATYRGACFTRLICVSLHSSPDTGEPLLLRSCAPVSPQE
jgi:hypothetical protein